MAYHLNLKIIRVFLLLYRIIVLLWLFLLNSSRPKTYLTQRHLFMLIISLLNRRTVWTCIPLILIIRLFPRFILHPPRSLTLFTYDFNFIIIGILLLSDQVIVLLWFFFFFFTWPEANRAYFDYERFSDFPIIILRIFFPHLLFQHLLLVFFFVLLLEQSLLLLKITLLSGVITTFSTSMTRRALLVLNLIDHFVAFFIVIVFCSIARITNLSWTRTFDALFVKYFFLDLVRYIDVQLHQI